MIIWRTDDLPGDLPAGVLAAAEALVSHWAASGSVAETRVSPSQLRALRVIDREQAVNLGGLADALGATPSSTSRLCDRLVAAGLVARLPGRLSRREITLELTRDGRDLLTDLDRARLADIGAVLRRMAPGARQQLLHGLQAFARAARYADGGEAGGDGAAASG